nr:phage integrase N-terminal SAM-like domain-containing protein [Xylanimonas allomyrinae]
MPRTPDHPDLAPLVESWVLSLRAERKSPATVKSYTAAVSGFLAWCAETGHPPVLTKSAVTAYSAHLLEAGREASTVRARQLGVRRFAAWLAEEGEIPADPLLGLRAPKLDQKIVEPLTSDQIKALIKACQGADLRDRRDEALIRFMVETGARAGRSPRSTSTTSTSSTGLPSSAGARAARAARSRSARRPLGHWTATAACVRRTCSRRRPRSGSAIAASRSTTTDCTRR